MVLKIKERGQAYVFVKECCVRELSMGSGNEISLGVPLSLICQLGMTRVTAFEFAHKNWREGKHTFP